MAGLDQVDQVKALLTRYPKITHIACDNITIMKRSKSKRRCQILNTCKPTQQTCQYIFSKGRDVTQCLSWTKCMHCILATDYGDVTYTTCSTINNTSASPWSKEASAYLQADCRY